MPFFFFKNEGIVGLSNEIYKAEYERDWKQNTTITGRLSTLKFVCAIMLTDFAAAASRRTTIYIFALFSVVRGAATTTTTTTTTRRQWVVAIGRCFCSRRWWRTCQALCRGGGVFCCCCCSWRAGRVWKSLHAWHVLWRGGKKKRLSITRGV